MDKVSPLCDKAYTRRPSQDALLEDDVIVVDAVGQELKALTAVETLEVGTQTDERPPSTEDLKISGKTGKTTPKGSGKYWDPR